MENKRLTKSFLTRTDVVEQSKELLGKFLVTNIDNQIAAGKIVETEAYRGEDDKACHAYQNRLTARTSVMFEEGGVAYIYLCYGIHHLFNLVTGPKGIANAILIRAIEPADNVQIMLSRRGRTKIDPLLTAGPGIASKALGITTKLTGKTLIETHSPFWIEDRGIIIPESEIIAGPRVGIDFAEECALWDWRFRIKGSKWVSKAK